MAEPIPPQRLAEITTCERETRPGPWILADANDGDGTPPMWVVATSEAENDDCDWAVRIHVGDKRVGEFIAMARTAVPELLAEVDRLAARVAELEAAIGRLAKIPLHEHARHWCAHDRDITRALGDVQPPPSGEAIAGILGSLAARTRTPDPGPVDDLPGMWDQSDLTGGETDTHTPRRGERGER